MIEVECPCCHGEKVLHVFEQERDGQKIPREPTLVCSPQFDEV